MIKLYFYGFDYLFIISIAITLIAQVYISSSYSKYKKVKITKEITGFEVARKILDKNGLKDVHVVSINGSLSDHYDPTRRVVRLSKEVFDGSTVAAVAVAAHEVGHAIQDKEGYTFMRIRSKIVPTVNFCSKIGYIVLLIGWIFGELQLAYVGIALLCATLIFQLVTLPVEFNASKRAKEQLAELHIVNSDEVDSCDNMLKSAAFTYVASLLTTLLQILRLFLMTRDRD
ncbi:MAG: zinc metallopeptidase [Bacilli bacterium]